MPIFAEQESKIFGDILYDLINSTNITRTSPGSKTRALAQATSKKLGRIWKQFDNNIIQAFLESASGRYLDYIGAMLGVSRLGEIKATTTSISKVIKFYVSTGTFGDINSSANINLPQGTIISTGDNQSGIKYRLINTVILAAGEYETFVSTEAVQLGSSANLGTGQLVYHSFTNYTDSLNKTLKVTNLSEIFTGQSAESDTNYRFRIANQTIAAERANITAIRLAALVVPGVADVQIIPFFRGVGTYDLLIKSTTPSVPDSLLGSVYQEVDKVTALGIVPYVRGPIEVGIVLAGKLTFHEAISDDEKNRIIIVAIRQVTDYINNLDINSDFIVNEVVEQVMSASSKIKNIGTANKPLDTLMIYKPSSTQTNRISSNLVGDYTAEIDEKVLVETTVNNPISFT